MYFAEVVDLARQLAQLPQLRGHVVCFFDGHYEGTCADMDQ
jgi:hypothetical protein